MINMFFWFAFGHSIYTVELTYTILTLPNTCCAGEITFHADFIPSFEGVNPLFVCNCEPLHFDCKKLKPSMCMWDAHPSIFVNRGTYHPEKKWEFPLHLFICLSKYISMLLSLVMICIRSSFAGEIFEWFHQSSIADLAEPGQDSSLRQAPCLMKSLFVTSKNLFFGIWLP